LDKFILAGGSAKKGEQVDLNLALKSLPAIINEENIERVELYNY
jgi:hypothetical protein